MKSGMRIISFLVVLMMLLLSFAGCKQQPIGGNSSLPGSESSDVSNSEAPSAAGADESSTSASEEESSSPAAASSGTSSKKEMPGTTIIDTTTHKPANLSGRVSNLNGRKIIFNTPAIDPNSAAAKRSEAWRKEIEKKYNCTIEVSNELSECVGNTAITLSVLAGKPKVDIWFNNGVNELFAHYQAGLLQNLSALNVFDFTSKDSPYGKSSQNCVFGTSYYGVNTSKYMSGNNCYSQPVVFFNQKLLKQYGITDDLYALQNSGQWTWAKFKELCIKFNQNCNDPNIVAMNDEDGWIYNTYLLNSKQDWIMPDKNGILRFTGGNAAGQEALTFFTNMYKDGAIQIGGIAGAQYYQPGNAWGATSANLAGAKWAFTRGQAAFTIMNSSMIQWTIMKNENCARDVKENFGMLLIPKNKASDKYTFSATAGLMGGWCIPYGVKKPNEVATILNELLCQPDTVEESKADFFEVHVDPYLPELHGENIRKTYEIMFDAFVKDDVIYTYNQLGWVTNPSFYNDPTHSWVIHVLKIAMGQESMSTVITAESNVYKKALENYTNQR